MVGYFTPPFSLLFASYLKKRVCLYPPALTPPQNVKMSVLTVRPNVRPNRKSHFFDVKKGGRNLFVALS